MAKEYRYKSTFASEVKAIPLPENDKQLSIASLKALKGLIPSDIDVSANPDAVYCAFNLATINRANRNDDVIDTNDALSIYKNFIYKPMDCEHNRSVIVGSMINAGFSSFGDNLLLSAEEIKDRTDVFNLTVAAVAWRILSEPFADKLVESSDETSSFYHCISASWELGFENYAIALGDKDLSKCELITNPKQIEEFSKFLKCNKGSGKTLDGVPVYRKIIGDMYPLAAGFVTNPAAEVKGIIIASDIIDPLKTVSPIVITVNPDKKTSEDNEKERKEREKDKYIQENKKKISPFPLNGVNLDTHLQSDSKNIDRNKTHMKLKFKDITKETLETATASDVYQVAEELNKSCSEFAAKLDAKASEAKAAQEKVLEIEAKYATLDKVSKEIEAKLKVEQESRAKEQARASFNSRMSELHDSYELNAAQAKAIAKQISTLTDETYAAWLEGHTSFLVAKKVKTDTEEDADEMEGDAEADAEAKKKAKAKKAKVDAEADAQMADFAKKDKEVKAKKKAASDEDDKYGEEEEETDEEKKAELADKVKMRGKKESKASLMEIIKSIEIDTPAIVNKVSGTKTLGECFAEAFAGLGEEK